MKSNVKEDVCYAQPKTLEQRVAIANDFVKRTKYPVPFGIDGMDNAANDEYAAWPERIYIVDENGHVAYHGGIGPFGYHPEEARAWFEKKYGVVKHPEKEKSADSSTGTNPNAENKTADAAKKNSDSAVKAADPTKDPVAQAGKK